MEEEEFEHIPWSHLTAREDDRRTRLIYLAIGAVAMAVIGVVGARWLTGPGHGEAAVVATSVASPPTTGDTPQVATTASTVTTTSLLTEADLMAPIIGASSNDESSMASMRAEWFVTDYFTVDHDPSALVDLERSFAAGLALPELPHAAGEPGGTSYVEWSRAYRVASEGDGVFTVAVAFRSIYLDDSGEFRRSPVRAAEVLVAVEGDSSGVVDLPVPLTPPRPGHIAASIPSGQASEAAVDEAMAYAWLFDEEPSLLEASEGAGGWRVVVGLRDGSGIAWPMAVRSDSPPR